MSAINEREFFPSSTINVDTKAPTQQIQQTPVINPDKSTVTTVDNRPSVDSIENNMDSFISQPTSLETKSSPNTFDWDKGERYRSSKNFKEFGYDPNAAPITDENGKTIDPNEARYAAVQTGAEKAYNAIVGGGKLFMDTFTRQAESWGDLVKGISTLASTGSWAKAQEAYMGTPAELEQMNKEQQDIMNKYAIFNGPKDDTIFSSSFIANSIQQFGLGTGQTVEMLAEVGLTWGAGIAIDAIRAGSIAAKMTEAGRVAEQALNAAKATGDAGDVLKAQEAAKGLQGSLTEASGNKAFSSLPQQEKVKQLQNVFDEIQKLSDISTNKELVTDMWKELSGVGRGLKNITPGSGLLDLGSDLYKAGKGVTGSDNVFKNIFTGAQNWGAWKGGVGSLAKDLSLFNMASTHGKLLAFTTYGAQYGDLVTQYERDHDGQLPTGDALELIKNNAMMAAKDVFTFNVPLIMLMSKIEWGGLFSKFSTTARTMKGLEPELAEGGESTLYSVKGKLAEGAALGEEEKVGDVAYKAYEKETKMFPAIRTFNTVRKDFGLGTALWQGAKVWGPSQLHKFEIAEGLHLLLQTVSDTHFRDYYKKVYDGSVDIHGHSFWDATNTGTWTKEMLESFNNHQVGQGFQTFIMGATGGLLMTPIHTLLSGVKERVMTNVSPAYKEASENRKAIVNENLKLMNTFYKDPKNVLKTHIDAIKSTGLATNNMANAASQGNKYAYHNAKNDLFAKTVSTFIKNGEFDSFLYTMKNMGNMDAKEFYEACPNMKPTDMGDDITKYPQPKVVVNSIIQGITEYYNRWNALKDKFSDLITPEYYEGRASKELQIAEERRTKAHQDLLNEYSDVKTGEDHLKLSDEDKVKNEQRFNELQQKQIKVEDIFNKNVADNKYYNAQMQKRALDEAIECIATLDYQSKKALERKVAIEGQFIDPKEVGVSISKHGSRILNTLGDKKATAKEILNIKKQLQILKPIEGQKELEDTKIQREALEKQLESLQQWQTAYNVEESHQKHSDEDKETLKVLKAGLPDITANLENLQNAHKGYIDGLNGEVGQTATPISKEEFDKSLSLLSEHINLSKDYSDYVKALNVITDPKGFQSLHDRIFDGMSYAMFDRYVREKQLLESYANYQKDKSEKEQEAKDIQDKKDRELSNLQKMKLSSLLNTVESDIKRVEASKEEIEKLIVETEAKLPSIEEDLKVAQSLLKENPDTPKNRKEFRKLEQSLRGKVKYLKSTIDRLKEQSQDMSLSLESLSILKERYSRAIEELERTSKPFESLHNIKDIQESITKEQLNELTQKYQGYKIEYAIQETQDQIDELNSRIEHFQKVVDATEKAINDIFNVVNFTDEDGGYPKRSLEIQQQQLIEKFENYSQDLKDAQSYLQILNEKHQRLVQTKEARENVASHINTLEYISTIKEALKEKKVDVSPNKTETTETKKTQEQKQKVKEKRVENTTKEVVSNALSGTSLSQEAKDDLTPEIKDAIKEAQEKLEQLKENVEAYPNGTDSEKEQLQKEEEAKIKAELEEQVKQLLEDDVELWDPKLNGLYEPPKATNGHYKLSLPNPTGTRFFKTKREYNDALRAYVENESKPGGRFEKIEGTDFQKGQTVYNKQGEAFLIQTGANDEGRVELKQKGKNSKINASTKTLISDYSDSPSELKPPTNPIEDVEEARNSPTITENEKGEKTLDSHKINFNNIFGVQLSKNKNESEADAALRFTNFILNNRVQLISDDATLELTALQNKEYKGKNSYTENLFENPNIRMRKAPLVYQLNIKVGNKIEPVYLRPNAAYYEFNVNGQWITPLQLIERADGKKLFYEFFNPPAEFYDKESSVTTTDIYNSFKNEIKKSAALDIVLSKMKDKDQLKGTQVTDLLGFDIVSYMRYGGDNDLKNETYPYSPLSEIPVSNSNYAKTMGAPTIVLNGQQFPAIIVNNKMDADKKPFILWADPEATSLEDSPIYQSTKQYRGNYPGTYSLLHQLSTGELHWIELSPSEMSIQEVSQRLSAIDKLIATHNGDLVKYLNDVPGGSEAVNNYLKDIFIVTNPYHTKGVIDENQKWKIVPALSQYQEGNKLKKETGEWGMTLHISQTIGEKGERQEFHLTMEKPSFSSAKDFVDSINRTLHERDSSGELKHKALAPLKVSEDDFRNQVFEDDINSIMNMKTNYAVANNNIVDKVDVLWHFKGDYEKIINDAMPKIIAKPITQTKPSTIEEKKADIEKVNEDNQKLGENILQKLGYKNENRQVNGNIKGGQDGWKIRFNIKNPKTGESYYTATGKGELVDAMYHKRAEILINFLLNYFGSSEKADPNNLQKHYVFTDENGKKREPFKHLTGGEFGESDFTIYVGSGDDTLKFISDIKNKHPEILDLLCTGNTSSDIRIDNIFKGRIEGSKIGFSGYHTPTNLYNITGENDFVFTYSNRRVVIDYGKSKSLNDISIYIVGDKKGYSGIYDKELQKDYPQLFENIRNIIGFQLYGGYLKGSNSEFVKFTGVNAELNAKPVYSNKALEALKNKIINEKELSSDMMGNIFRVVNEKEYNDWLKKQDMQSYEAANNNKLALAEDRDHLYRIISKDFLPLFIDYKTQKPAFELTLANSKLLINNDYYQKEGQWFREDGTPVIDLQAEINSITAGTPTIPDAQINEKSTKQQVLENETTTPSIPVETDDWGQAYKEQGNNRDAIAEKRIGKEERFDLVSIDNIEEFNKWCGQNLPMDILSIEDRGVFIKNLLDNNVTVGTFYSYMEGINQKGKMSVYKNTPFKYHEAFHGVFRLLLNQQQIDQLLSIAAKENFATPEKLQAFREKGYNYAEHEIKARFYEEYLADKFEAWKQNHKTDTSHVVKSFFRKIVDFFKELWAKLSGNKIEGLFYEINRGKFKNARLQENMFTGQEGIAINQPALKSIPVGTQEINGTIINRYLPQQDANNLSSSIAALFLKQLNSDPIYQRTKKYDKNTILDNIIDMYAETFDLSNKDRMDAYKKLADSNFKDPEEKRRWREKLFDRAYLFNRYERDGKTPNPSRKALKESVDEYLKIFGLKQKLDADKAESDELEDGILNTNKLERESAFTIGGFGALPTLMRQFIGTTTYTLEDRGKRDEFFNHSFSNGQPMVMSVDANKVYNGMLKCLSNTSDSKVILDKIINFIQNDNNPETKQFINFLFENAGIDPKNVKDSCGNIIATKNANLLQQVVKAFNQYFVNTKYIGIIGDKFTVSDANVKDASYYQISNWQNNFMQTFYNSFIADPTQTKLKTATSSLRILKNLIDYKDTAVIDHKINEKSKEISDALENYLGISLHPDYIKYSILKSKVKPEDQPQTLTKEQKDWVSSYPLVTEIQPGPLENLISQLNSNDKNIFSKDDKGAKTSYQTLKFWADGNMIFDEGINLMSHTNAAGENVTNYVLPFYSAVQIGDMNKGYTDWLKGLSTDFQKEIENNPLLKNDNFKYLMNKGMLSVEFIDGMRLEKEIGDDEEETQNQWVETYIDPETNETIEGHYELSDKKVRMDKSKEGLTYADFNDKDFISSLFSFYNTIGQNDCQVFKSKDSSFYRVLIPIRVPAEKSMFSIIKLPVIHSVLKNAEGKITLTENALSILYNRIEEEFNRIRDVYNMTSDGKTLSGHNKIEDWNTGKMKGLRLFMTEDWVGPELKKDIETEAKKEGGDLSSLKEKIEKQLNGYLLGDKGQVQQMINKMVKEGMIIEDDGDYISAGKLENQGLVPGYLFKGLGEKEDSKLFLSKGNFKQNIAQVCINAFLNTSLINNLLHGDESKLYKNGKDAVKRESSTMAIGPSMEGVIADKNVGVEKALKEYYHLTYTDETVNKKLTPDDTLKVDDGHGLCTAKGYLYMLYGKGTLNTTQAAILQKLINGQKVTPEEFFESGGLKDNGAFNSLKMVHSDGQVYLKFSVTPLFKSFTSYRDSDGFWKARPGKEALHDLRVTLENFEDKKETIAIAHPSSSSKMLTRNVYDTSKGFKNVEDHHFEKLQTKFFKEQLQNPSSKVEITDPSQPKLQLPAEQNLDTLTMYKGKMVPMGEVLKSYMDNIAQRISNNFTTARDGLFKIEDVTKNIKDSINAGRVTPELAKFLTSAKENLEATGANSQMLEFMELDKNNQPKYNINFPSILPKIESIFFSYFSKGVLRETVPGHSMALISPAHGAGSQVKQVKSIWTQADIDRYGEDQKLLGQPKEWVVVTQREFEKSPKKYSQLKKYNNKDERRFDGLEKALKKGPVYILDDLRDNYLKFKNNEPIGYFTEALIPAHFKEQAINGFTDEDRFGFGTRIPYVDKNSATSFEFVDQLPVEMGSVIMAAREYYERTGADNDIDKDYVSVPDTYVNSGDERIQYGYAKTEQGQFNEYVHYLLNNNKDVKSLYYGDKLYTTDGVIQALTDNFDKDARIKNVLKDLKLPSNVEEFIKAGGVRLNNGVLNNNILAAKIAMLNNKETVKNANTPTTTQPLIDVVNDLVKDFEEFKDKDGTYGQFVYNMLTEKNADINFFLGMVNDRAATMMGADSIGSVATTNIVYSFLNHMKTDLRNSAITIDGHSFNSFNNVYAWDKETESYKNDPKTRIFAALACLTNTMTDNAKERNANKLNLGKTATGFAAYLLATGMPEKTTYLYMIQPSMLQYTKLKTSGILSTEEESLSATAYLKSRIKELTDAKVIAKELTTQDLIDNIKEDGTDESKELAILQDIQKMEKQSETYFKVAKVLRLNQGIKGTMEDFDTILSDLKDLGIKIENGKIEKIEGKEFEKLPTCIDIRDALTKNHSFMANILNAVKQIDSCMPSMFIERTELFKNMTEGAMKSLVPPVSPIELPKFKKDLKYDLISYLSIRALKNALETPGNPLYQQNNSLNQNLIYGESDDNIVNKIQKVKDALKNATKKGVTNYLLEYYLVTSEPSDKTGYLHVVEANTWAKLSDIQQNKLIASFVDLYQDAYKRYGVYTHDLANDMFNYLLVKDGGQFKNGSFIKMLPPFIFKDIMNKIGATNEAMKSNSFYESLFGKGVNEQSLLTEFLKGYTTHVANKKLILNVPYSNSTRKLIVKQKLQGEGNSIVVNAFGDIRANNDNTTDKKTGGFSEAEKQKLKDNKEKLSEAGFTMNDGSLSFPMAFQQGNRLYTLKEVYQKNEEEGKWKPVLTDSFLAKGEFVPIGLKAKYVETEWTGSKNQFPAASAIGPVPVYKLSEMEQKYKNRLDKSVVKDASRENMKNKGYTKKIISIKLGGDKTASVEKVVTPEGKLIGTKGELYTPNVENGVITSVTDASGRNVQLLPSQFLGDLAKVDNIIKAKENVVPSQPMENKKSIEERSHQLLNSTYTTDELNNLFKNRKDKTRNSVQYRDKIYDVTKGVLEMNWNSKKEQQESLKSIINCL